jgi:hypothetical protein
MRAGVTVLAMFLLLPSLAGCGSKATDPANRPHVLEETDPTGVAYVPRPMLADDDSVGVYTDEEALLAAHPGVTPACYFRDYADFIIRFSDVTRNSWEQEKRFQFVKDRTEMARWTARGCGAEAVLLKESSTLVRPRRVFNSQTGGIRWINGRERVVLEWFALSATPVPQPASEEEGEGDGN